MNQITEILNKLPSASVNNMRRYFLNLVKKYYEKRHPSHVHRLESEYGACIDEKDYGADQNVERGQEEY